jgi:hypothetical protein
LSRRQALTRISTGAAAGAAVWIVPEILTAKPAAGATMSTGPTGGGTNPVTQPTNVSTAQTSSSSSPTNGSSGTSDGGGTGGTHAVSTAPTTLAMTGLDIKRDAELGAAMVAGGWAMHRWASRMPKGAVAAAGDAHEAGSTDPSA